MKILLLALSILFFNSNQKSENSETQNQIYHVHFVIHNYSSGCNYTFNFDIDDITHAGNGWIEQECGGRKRRKYYDLIGNVTPVRLINESDIVNLKDENGNPTTPFPDFPLGDMASVMTNYWQQL
jgi:capsid portal protein